MHAYMHTYMQVLSVQYTRYPTYIHTYIHEYIHTNMNESRYSSLTTVARVEPEIFSVADVDVVAMIAAAPNNKRGAAAAITGALYKYVT